MSDVNLNRPVAEGKPPERFDLKRHVHEEKPFLSGFGMLVSVVIGTASLGAAFIGGAYLLAGGKVPEFAKVFHEEEPVRPSKPGEVAEQQVKSTEEEITDLVQQQYASAWNGKWDTRPESLFASSFSSTSPPEEAKGDHLDGRPDGSITISQSRLDGFVLLSDSRALADATFLLARALTAKGWWDDGPSPANPDAPVVVERAIRYAFELDRTSNGWRIARQTWLKKSPARIRDASDSQAEELTLPGISTFPEQRPEIASVESTIQTLASNMAYGVISMESFFNNFELTLADGSKRTFDQMKERLTKFRGKTTGITLTPKVHGIAQTDPFNATALVSYRLTFAPQGSVTNNVYTATWSEKVTFNIGEKRTGWRIGWTERLSSSPILDYYSY